MTREQIEKAWEEHTLCNPSMMDELSLNERQMFVKGARWRINSVWHDASEVPEANKRVLVCFEDVIGEYVYYRIRAFKPNVLNNWNMGNFSLYKVLYWCYLDDLLPERKEETE